MKEIQVNDIWLSRTGGIYQVLGQAEDMWQLKNLRFPQRPEHEPAKSVVFGELIFRPKPGLFICQKCGKEFDGVAPVPEVIPPSCNKPAENEMLPPEKEIPANSAILIIDIETTGFLNAGGSIVEIGAVSLDLESGDIKEAYSSLCREDIFNEKHTWGKYGWIFQNSDLNYSDVLGAPSFESVKLEVQHLIDQFPAGCTAFNNKFDFDFLESRGIKFRKKLPCPMKISVPVCKVPKKNGKGGFKYPNVEEAFRFFFPDRPYVEAHRGLDDATHEAMIVHELYKRGVFKV